MSLSHWKSPLGLANICVSGLMDPVNVVIAIMSLTYLMVEDILERWRVALPMEGVPSSFSEDAKWFQFQPQ